MLLQLRLDTVTYQQLISSVVQARLPSPQSADRAGSCWPVVPRRCRIHPCAGTNRPGNSPTRHTCSHYTLGTGFSAAAAACREPQLGASEPHDAAAAMRHQQLQQCVTSSSNNTGLLPARHTFGADFPHGWPCIAHQPQSRSSKPAFGTVWR